MHGGYVCADPPFLTLDLDGLPLYTLTHELAHVEAGCVAQHDGSFRGAHLRLLAREYGQDVAARFDQEYARRGLAAV